MTTTPPRARILIVEDEHIVALDLQGLLAELGFEAVGHAASAPEAVALANELKPDLALIDINLGGKEDGIDAAQQIKRDIGIPVIYVTAYDDARTLARAQVTEPYGYILKPYQGRELRACIRMALHHHAMQQERQRLTQDLESALAGNRLLQGLLTTCRQCHRIHDRDRGWVSPEEFARIHSAPKSISGCCPDCELPGDEVSKRS
jgi:DNA-binding NarL/FixJ family response regulator